MTSAEVTPTDPKRVRSFATFFKNYMSLSTLVVAALPIPVTAAKLIPVYKAQTGVFSVYSSLFCFLILGFVFYNRHSLAKVMFYSYGMQRSRVDATTTRSGRLLRFFSERLPTSKQFMATLPFYLIILSLTLVFVYHNTLNASVVQMLTSVDYSSKSMAVVLEDVELVHIPYSSQLMIFYIAFYAAAETAFVLMAVKEYLLDLLNITDTDFIRGSYSVEN